MANSTFTHDRLKTRENASQSRHSRSSETSVLTVNSTDSMCPDTIRQRTQPTDRQFAKVVRKSSSATYTVGRLLLCEISRLAMNGAELCLTTQVDIVAHS